MGVTEAKKKSEREKMEITRFMRDKEKKGKPIWSKRHGQFYAFVLEMKMFFYCNSLFSKLAGQRRKGRKIKMGNG